MTCVRLDMCFLPSPVELSSHDLFVCSAPRQPRRAGDSVYNYPIIGLSLGPKDKGIHLL